MNLGQGAVDTLWDMAVILAMAYVIWFLVRPTGDDDDHMDWPNT